MIASYLSWSPTRVMAKKASRFVQVISEQAHHLNQPPDPLRDQIPINRRMMKNRLPLLLLLGMVMATAGCASTTPPTLNQEQFSWVREMARGKAIAELPLAASERSWIVETPPSVSYSYVMGRPARYTFRWKLPTGAKAKVSWELPPVDPVTEAWSVDILTLENATTEKTPKRQ
jgi:hypothetical protein